MPRPTLLVAEPEPQEALSTRKLVLETGKFNVITAHSTQEAIDVFNLFPRVSAAVVVSCQHIDCEMVVQAIRSKNGDGKVPIIALSPRIGFACNGADYLLTSHEPHALLELVRNLLGDPRSVPSADDSQA